MEMTNYEIARSYRESKEHRKQIGILADLNCCSTAKIRDILRSEGIVLPGGAPKALKKTDKEKISDVKAELQDVKAESGVKVTAVKIEPVEACEFEPMTSESDDESSKSKPAAPRGYTIYEVAESRRQQLLEEYEFANHKYNEALKLEEQAKTIRKTYSELIREYRHRSVDRVLDYIRSAHITDQRELDTLLCHCQNKLNGNIDGVEIKLSEVGNEDGNQDTEA